MDPTHRANALVPPYLARCRPEAPVFAAWDDVVNPYYRCGCHPDIVERLWDQIGPALPADCRALVHGIPALVQPQSGVILATGLGTQYGVRVPLDLIADAIRAGAKTTTTWSGGATMDIQQSLGVDWLFGGWRAEELHWGRILYEATDRSR